MGAKYTPHAVIHNYITTYTYRDPMYWHCYIQVVRHAARARVL